MVVKEETALLIGLSTVESHAPNVSSKTPNTLDSILPVGSPAETRLPSKIGAVLNPTFQ